MKTLYEQTNFADMQYLVYETREATIHCAFGDIRIMKDQTTGLVYNAASRPGLMVYDAHYNNEQGVEIHSKVIWVIPYMPFYAVPVTTFDCC